MSCYIPVIERLKKLNSSANGNNSVKSNVSKSKAVNGGRSASHLQYLNERGLQNTSQCHVPSWKPTNAQTLHQSNKMGSPSLQNNTDLNNYYLNDKARRTLGIDFQRNSIGVSSQLNLEQHHFLAPSSPIPSPPPSYHSNNIAETNTQSVRMRSIENNTARSPPPPYDNSKSAINNSTLKEGNTHLHVLPLPSSTNNTHLNYTYQNDTNIQNQHLPPRPPKHEGKRSQVRRRDQSGLTIVQQIGSFPNNVPLNIRHNNPTLGLSDVAYQRQHSDHGRYRIASPSKLNEPPRVAAKGYPEGPEKQINNEPTLTQKSVLTLGLPSHWKKLPFRKSRYDENDRRSPARNNYNAYNSTDMGSKDKDVFGFSSNTKEANNKLSYLTAPSDLIHHTYETLSKPSSYQQESYGDSEDGGSGPRNTSRHEKRNSSLPRRLRKSKTPIPNSSKAHHYRPRSAQDNLIPSSSNIVHDTMETHSKNFNIYANEVEHFDPNLITALSFNGTKFEESDTNNAFKSGSDQDDDEGIGEGDISTGSKSVGRNTTSSSGASSGGSRSPDDDEESSRQLVHCVESNVNNVKSANRRYLPTLPSPTLGPPPRHLLPSKLKPSPAFKMHPLPLLKEQLPNRPFRTADFSHFNNKNLQLVNGSRAVKDSNEKYQKDIHNIHCTETLRIQGKIESNFNADLVTKTLCMLVVN